ncbi:MAG: hypothetical protein QW407_06655 [Thermofilaceae archaeon]
MRRSFIKALIVALASVLLGGAGGWLLHTSGVSEELEGPFIREEGASAALLNAAMFVAMLLVGALLLLALLRFRVSALKLLGYATFALAAFTVGEIYLAALNLDPAHATVLSTAFTALTIILIAFQPLAIYTVSIQILVGALIGAVIAAMVPPLSMVTMLVAAALYDVYSVYRGPLKRIIQRVSGEQRDAGEQRRSLLTPFAVNVGGLALGMGDVILYSSLSSVALLTPTPDYCRLVVIAAAVLIGLFSTLKIVEKKGYAPALPLPILLSIAAFLLYNYVLFGSVI